MSRRSAALLGIAVGLVTLYLPSRVVAQTHVEVPTQAPRPEDVASLDGIMKAFYDVISGPAGQPRQWGRDRSLYVPDIRFVATGVDKQGQVTADRMSHQQFVDAADAGMVKSGFFESEIHRVTQRFGNIAQIMSTYEMRSTPGGALIGRGINSVQLYWDGKRWWISSVVWDDEREGAGIPAEFGGAGSN